jgi:hypothetical protein
MSMELYHGTDPANAEAIVRNGFKLSVTGRLGMGVYMVPAGFQQVAAAVSNSKSGGKGIAILTCRVKLSESDIKTLSGSDRTGSWRATHKAARGPHGGWKRLQLPAFTEYVIRDPALIEVVRLDLDGATIGTMYKSITLGISGTCRINGDIGRCSIVCWNPPPYPKGQAELENDE